MISSENDCGALAMTDELKIVVVSALAFFTMMLIVAL